MNDMCNAGLVSSDLAVKPEGLGESAARERLRDLKFWPCILKRPPAKTTQSWLADMRLTSRWERMQTSEKERRGNRAAAHSQASS